MERLNWRESDSLGTAESSGHLSESRGAHGMGMSSTAAHLCSQIPYVSTQEIDDSSGAEKTQRHQLKESA